METPKLDVERIKRIFFPYAARKSDEVKKTGARFVHYTTAEAALEILRNEEVWMRNAKTMNDFMEVEHGFECLKEAWKGESGKDLKEALEVPFPGITGELESRFNGWLPTIRNETFITCFSEHLDREDTLGRLSMWRAYGESVGVALVINPAPFFLQSNALRVYSSPVAYMERDAYASHIHEIANAVRNESAFVRDLGREHVFSFMFTMMRFGVLCTKHPGFSEEREWRVIHSPRLDQSTRLVKEVRAIGGVPQVIMKIPLKDVPAEGLVGVELPLLINRLVIGPTEFPMAVRSAFSSLLSDKKVINAAGLVWVSEIPLR